MLKLKTQKTRRESQAWEAFGEKGLHFTFYITHFTHM